MKSLMLMFQQLSGKKRTRYVLCLDASSSMRAILEMFLTGWEESCERMIAKSVDLFRLVTFNSSRLEHTGSSYVEAGQLPIFSIDEYRQLTSGGTYLRDTFMWAIQECFADHADAVRLLTDGWDRGESQETEFPELLQVLKEARAKQIDIFIVGFGTEQSYCKFRRFVESCELKQGEWDFNVCEAGQVSLANAARKSTMTLSSSMVQGTPAH